MYVIMQIICVASWLSVLVYVLIFVTNKYSVTGAKSASVCYICSPTRYTTFVMVEYLFTICLTALYVSDLQVHPQEHL